MKRNLLHISLGILICVDGIAAAEPDWVGPLDQFFRDKERQGFAGAALVEQNGQVVFERAYGVANRELNIPWTTDTVFCIGSVTKQFTAAAIVKLQTEGKLTVQDSIANWVSGLSEEKSQITLHHLLTHSAGVPDLFGGEFQFDMDFDPNATDAWMLDQFRSCQLLWGPEDFGKRHEYSNAGYSLLAHVVTKTSGIPYEAYLHQAFFDPLDMNHTGYYADAWKPEDFAHGYRRDEDTGVVVLKHPLPDGPSWNLRGNGGICSTLGDLLTWHHALLDHRVFDEATFRLIETPYVRLGEQSSGYYAYGWAVIPDENGELRFRGHNGGDGVNFADFRWYPQRNTLVLLASTTWKVNLERSVPKIMQTILPPSD